MNIFYPSCNFTIASKETAQKVRNYFKERMDVAGCCLYDKREASKADTAFYFCQNCRKTLEDKMNTVSIWEYFDSINDFAYPDYKHKKMVLQDCYRDREHPEVHKAVRSIMNKMNIDVIEMDRNKDKSVYCGTLHYETENPILLDKLKQYTDTKISQLPLGLQKELMKDNFKDIDDDLLIVVDCNRCLKGVELADKKGIHLLNLLFQ